jgi:uncharacterized Ntn-hydrolase superfamily protein
MTYSIVARDPATGEMGVAVQTCYFAVGAIVPWAEPGVGAVATQSFTEASYGPLGLDRMRDGQPAAEALGGLVEADEGSRVRQVAMVDATGAVAVHTGGGCVAEAGHVTGDGVCAQANMMERATVWGAMLSSFTASPAGPLVERLIAALDAAQAEGGDIRGRQSAALLVVSGDRSDPPWKREVDLRVDDHPDPVGELRRLLVVHRATREIEAAQDLAAAFRMDEAAAHADAAAALAPRDPLIAFVRGGILASVGRVDESRSALEAARAANPRYPIFLRRLAQVGIVPNDPALLDALMPL